MNLAHVHLLLNHFPTVGMIVGLGVFVMAILAKSDHLKRASLGIFFCIALLSIPAFATGTAARLALAKTPEVSKAMIDAHETAAFEALWFMELTGALAWLGLWQYRRLSRVPQGTLAAVLLAGLATLRPDGPGRKHRRGIRHPEIRTGPAPVETATTNRPRESHRRRHGEPQVGLAGQRDGSFHRAILLFGVVLLVDLRMLGFMKGIPYSALHRLLPWGVLGFGVNVVTGMLFFIGAPPDFYVNNPVFIWKLALVLVAGANALYFTVVEQTWTLEAGDTPPMAAKVAAASGILLWVGVIFCGQMLPFFGHSF